jgi:hypothetical protein
MNGILAESLTVTAQVDREKVALGDTVTYEITVSGKDLKNVPAPVLPNLNERFNTISTFTSSSFSMMDNQFSSSKKQSFILKPLKTGVLMIGPASIEIEGTLYQTNTLEITVVSGNIKTVPKTTEPLVSTAPRGNVTRSVFLEASLNKNECYVGEPIVYALNLAQAVRLWGNVSYELPEFPGLLLEDMPATKNAASLLIENKKYYLSLLTKKILVAITPGELEIAPARATYMTNPFEGQQTVISEPLKVNVLPLPSKNRPLNFSGLVGEFELTQETDKTTIPSNTPVIAKITLKGTGNFTSITELDFKARSDVKIYKSKVEENLEFKNNIEGTKIFEYIIVPQVSGQIKFSGFEVTYFSLKDKNYKTIKTPAITLMVTENKNSGTLQKIQPTEKKPQKIDTDLAFLKTNITLQKKARYGSSYLIYKILFLGILGGLIYFLSLILKDKLEVTAPLKLKQKKAALKAYEAVNRLDKNAPAFLTKTYNIFMTFLAAFLQIPAQEKTNQELKKNLEIKQIKAELCADVINFIENLTAAVYAPTPVSDLEKQRLYQQALDLIKMLGEI